VFVSLALLGLAAAPAFAGLPVDTNPDLVGPAMDSFGISPTTVDVTASSQTITATAHLTDDKSGVADVQVRYLSPSGHQSIVFRFTASDRTSGDANDGDYATTAVVDTYRESGAWQVSQASTTDVVGNVGSYTAAQVQALGAVPFTVTSNPSPDTIAPEVTAVRVTPSLLDVSLGDGFPTFQWDATDTGGSGVLSVYISLTSASSRQRIAAQAFDYGTVGQDALTMSGVGMTSTWTPAYNFWEDGLSRYSEPGAWTVNYVQVTDRAYNTRTYLPGVGLDAILATPFFEVASDPTDTAAPAISAFRFSPASIDVSTAPATVAVEFDVADELSGVQAAWLTFRSPTIATASPQYLERPAVFNQYLTDIRITDGIVQASVTFPTYDRGGDWTVAALCVVDRVKHQVCYTGTALGNLGPTTLNVVTAAPPANADLTLTKTGPVTAHAGEELTYLVRVKNNGPDVATGVQVVDTLPAGLDFVSVVPDAPVCTGTITIVCGLGTLSVGEVKAVTIVARGRVPGPVHNDAHASANEHDPNPIDNTAGWSTDVGPAAANVTISKAARILTGPRLQYTIDVENLGPSVATGVVAKDMLDPMWALIDVTTTQGSCTGRVICAIGTLALGQKETVTITVGLTSPGPVHNEATVGWDGGGIASASVDSPPFPDLRISKSHVGSFKAGQTGSYLLSVSNVGTGPTTSAIVVADTLPAGMTFDSGVGGGFTCLAADQLVTCTRSEPLGAGDSASFMLSVLVATDAPPLVTNVARVAGGGGVYQLDGASDPGGVLPPPVIGLTKRVKEQTVRVGHNLTYLIDVTNTGGQDATNVRVIDTLPASVDLVSVNPGAPTCIGTTTITCSLGDLPVDQTTTVEIIVRPRLVTLLTNQATATADGIVVPATGSVSTEILPPPDLGVTKEASAPVVVQDSLLRYTITAKNLGPGDATNVKINDPLPTGVTLVSVQPDSTYAMTCNVTAPPEISNLSGPVVCTIPVLPELTTSKVVLTVRVVRFGSLLNTATVSSDDPDPGSGNDAATATVLVNRPPTADPFGPYTVPEGGSVHLSGAGSDPDSDAITFAWDLDGDAIFETASQNPVFSAATIDGPSARTVSLKVCDTKGACTIKDTTVTITNVAPQITSVTNSGPVMIATPVQVAVVATDVAGPTRDPLRYEFDCDNNGTYEIGPQANASAACTFTASGIRTVRVRVNDGDGGIAIGSTDVLAYAYPGTGQFVIGNLTSHAVGNRANFWGAQWAKNNPLSGGAPPTAFKGFDSSSTIPTCGSSWTSNPGNSSVPPQSVPQYLAVIVSSKVAKSGSLISGDIKQVVIVKTDPGYSSDSGHPGTGTVTAVLCTVR
jgi:conserved repeat domain/conserved repeat domain/conserved repeat domain/conserved repeat domain/conserved repeat domain